MLGELRAEQPAVPERQLWCAAVPDVIISYGKTKPVAMGDERVVLPETVASVTVWNSRSTAATVGYPDYSIARKAGPVQSRLLYARYPLSSLQLWRNLCVQSHLLNYQL